MQFTHVHGLAEIFQPDRLSPVGKNAGQAGRPALIRFIGIKWNAQMRRRQGQSG